ncbi:hypothetical protein PV10_02097 [Exophiala mesophila]|uniref:Eukaryotic translation initiation factor 3 subunit M n=1 Tax=Exophiala mesophila TaxID=212818 RepID=A0A0D2A5N6_EXOME|nr:uncharacterized protein PV10_02097 [Exophiala mesophila]KIV94323.1 hypothetical protein PV10_02097 [Exophiala mesophila]
MPGPSNTLLIEGTFSELAEELAQYLDVLAKSAEGAGVNAEIEPLLNPLRESEQNPDSVDDSQNQKQKDEVLKKLVTKAPVLHSAPEREFTAAYNLLISLSTQSSILDQIFARLCQYLSEQPISSSPTYGPSLALQTLSTIFNVLPSSSESRYHVFLAILKVIKSSNSTQSFEALKSQLDTNVPHWLSAWQLDDDDKQEFYVTLADVASSVGYEDLSYTYLLSALEVIPPESASENDSVELAKRVLKVALTNPSVLDFTPLTASDAVQATRKTDPNLFELLEIFSSDDYAAYKEFLSSNSLPSIGLDESASETLTTKIRLLTLASVAASSQTRSVSYSSIASALQVDSDEVEMWVIDTIRAGLIEGKLSQQKQELLVQRATYRVFGEKQWTEIQGRLAIWRRSLETVLQTVRAERERFLREGPGGNDGAANGFADGEGRPHHGGDRGQRRQGGGRGGRTGGHRGGDRGDRGDREQQQNLRELDVGGD